MRSCEVRRRRGTSIIHMDDQDGQAGERAQITHLDTDHLRLEAPAS